MCDGSRKKAFLSFLISNLFCSLKDIQTALESMAGGIDTQCVYRSSIVFI